MTSFALPSPAGLAFAITSGPDGALWFTYDGEASGQNSDRIGHITTSGATTAFPLPESGCNVDGIAAGSDGNLWFTEVGQYAIGRITPPKS